VLLQVFKQERSLRRDAQEIPGGFFTMTVTTGRRRDRQPIRALLSRVARRLHPASSVRRCSRWRDRTGGLLEVQFKPSDNLTLGLSGFLSDMDANNYNRNFMLWGGNFAPRPGAEPGLHVVENGVLTSATYAGVAGRDYAVYDMISREATAKSNYVTFDADWRINDYADFKFQVGTTEGQGSTARQFIAEVTTNRGGGASWTSHGTSRPWTGASAATARRPA
jgi:iron complex outermembrane receptor protein